jgi:hypothetical protein
MHSIFEGGVNESPQSSAVRKGLEPQRRRRLQPAAVSGVERSCRTVNYAAMYLEG